MQPAILVMLFLVFAIALIAGLTGLPALPRIQTPAPEEEKRAEEQGDPMIWVTAPAPDTMVTSPLRIAGMARGNWFFEASFPARVLDADGKELGVAPIMTAAEWMTTDFVPFEGEVSFATSTTPAGTLVLEKDNPSGLPEHADERRIPILFSPTEQ